MHGKLVLCNCLLSMNVSAYTCVTSWYSVNVCAVCITQVDIHVNVRLPSTNLSTTVVTAAELSVNRKVQGRASSATRWSVLLLQFVLVL